MPEGAALQRQVLERMVTSRILVQNARRTGIRVTDAQLNKAIDRMAEENSLSREKFREAMESEGLDISRFRERIRMQIMIARLKERSPAST